MRVGFALGNIGPIGTAENLLKIAQRAEALAYDSLWTVERLLWPVAPQTPYVATPDGSLPEEYKRVLDPLDVLSGGRVRLGLGLGWSKDEHDAVGAPMKQRGARADEFLAVMKTIWTADPA